MNQGYLKNFNLNQSAVDCLFPLHSQCTCDVCAVNPACVSCVALLQVLHVAGALNRSVWETSVQERDCERPGSGEVMHTLQPALALSSGRKIVPLSDLESLPMCVCMCVVCAATD